MKAPGAIVCLIVGLGAAAAGAAQWPIANPNFSGFPPNDYGTYALTTSNGYHTGMDLVGTANPCAYSTQVVAGVDGTVAILQPLGPCVTPPVGSCPGSGCQDDGLGNSVTVLGNDGIHYTYGHLDSIDTNLQVGQIVSPSTLIGIMGNSSYGVPRHGYCPGVPACGGGQDFKPHLHFESKSAAFIGNGYSGFAPDFAGYRDAVRQIYPVVPITPTVIRVLPSPLHMQGVPDYQGFFFPPGSYQTAAANAGDRYVAYEQAGTWLHIYVPPVKALPTELWIPATLSTCAFGRCCTNGQCVVIDTAPLPVVRVVSPPSDNGVIARTQPSSAAAQVARLWDGDMYITLARQLPQPGDVCTGEWFQLQAARPSSMPASVVWVCSRTKSRVLLEVREPCDTNGECNAPGICQSGPGTCTPTGCVYPVTVGAACDDGDACSSGDTCADTALCAGTSACTPTFTPTVVGTATRTSTRTRTPTPSRTPTITLPPGSPVTSSPTDTRTATPTAAPPTATPVTSSTPTVTRTATSTATLAPMCTTFATGVCCDSADGANCRVPTLVCTSNSACAAQAPYTVCAGASSDDGSVTSTLGPVYADLTVNACSMTSTMTGVARNLASGTYAIFDGLLQWDTSGLPDDAVPTSATLIQSVILASSANGRDYQGEWFNWGTCDTSDWTPTAANTAFSIPISAIAGGNADNSFVLAGAGANINVTGRTYLRLHISGGQPTGINRVNAALYEHATLPGPRLRVCYVQPTPTVTAAATSTSTPTSSPTPTDTDTPTSTSTPDLAPTLSPTDTHTPTETATPEPSQMPTSTPTATDTAPATETPTATETAPASETPSVTPTATDTFTPTSSATNSPPASATPTPTATATRTSTATATATTAQLCTTFATGVCCDSADGTTCRAPTLVCTSDSACAAQTPYTICAGAPSDDGSITSNLGPVYADLVVNACSMTSTMTGVARNLAAGTYAIFDGLLQWDTSRLPDDAVPTSATLIQTMILASSTNNRNYQGEWFNWGTCDATDWTPTAANSAFSVPISTITSGNTDNSFALTGAAGNINVTGRTFLRLHISGGQPTGLNRVNAALYEHATLPGPRLRVCYVQPTPTPSQP